MSASSGSSASAAAVKAAVGVEMAALKVAAEEEAVAHLRGRVSRLTLCLLRWTL